MTFPNFKYWMGLGFRVVLFELRQFRVKGLGYMSLRLRFPNVPFPKSCWPIWAGVFWEIGNLGNGLGEICL